MAEQHQQQTTFKSLLPEKGPTTSQVLAVITLLPIGGILLTLSGLTLTGSLIGLAVITPLFILFSPVLVPAAIVLALAVTGFLASGAFGLTAVSSLTWIMNYVRGSGARGPEGLEQMKRRMQEAAGQIGQRARDVGQGMQGKVQEGGRT